MTAAIPQNLLHLVTEPYYGVLGTVRPDNTVQVNPMWFEYDGEHLRFTHTSKRAKFRNLRANPSMSLAVMDPADPNTYVELRGALVETIADPTGSFHVHLAKRYGRPDPQPPADSADRVILVMSVDRVLGH